MPFYRSVGKGLSGESTPGRALTNRSEGASKGDIRGTSVLGRGNGMSEDLEPGVFPAFQEQQEQRGEGKGKW